MNSFLTSKPKRSISELSTYLDKFFNDSFFSPSVNHSFPKANIYVLDDTGELKMDFALAGFKKKDIKIDLDPETYYLTISSESVTEEDPDNLARYVCREIAQRSFKIRYQIPTCYDIENVNAEMEDGILNITFKKNPEKEKKLIEIK